MQADEACMNTCKSVHHIRAGAGTISRNRTRPRIHMIYFVEGYVTLAYTLERLELLVSIPKSSVNNVEAHMQITEEGTLGYLTCHMSHVICHKIENL